MNVSKRQIGRRSAISWIALAAIAFAAAPAGCEDTASQAPATRTIVLVRHGHYVPDEADSSPGPGLSQLGFAQAKLVAARLAGMPGAFDAIVASPMTRAQETAKTIAEELHGVPFETLPGIAECTPATRRTEVTKDETPEEMAACAAKLDAVFAKRFVPATGRDRRELFVCHGNVIRYLVTKALGVDTQAWLEMSVAHASMTTIRVEPDGRFKVLAVGDIGHVPPNLQTGSSGMDEKRLGLRK